MPIISNISIFKTLQDLEPELDQTPLLQLAIAFEKQLGLPLSIIGQIFNFSLEYDPCCYTSDSVYLMSSLRYDSEQGIFTDKKRCDGWCCSGISNRHQYFISRISTFNFTFILSPKRRKIC